MEKNVQDYPYHDGKMSVLRNLLSYDYEINSVERSLLDRSLPDEPKQYFKSLYHGWTQTLHPKYYQKMDFIQFYESSRLIDKYLRAKGINYLLVPELTKEGNIHFHGYVDLDFTEATPAIKLKTARIRNRLRVLLGFSKVSYISDSAKWWAYVWKEYEDTIKYHKRIGYFYYYKKKRNHKEKGSSGSGPA